MGRRAGVSVPLFSCRSTRSWGIGELPDIVPLSEWLAAGGFAELMVLPLGTMPEGETSPYSATSTLAIDPIYISLEAVPDFSHAGGIASLSDAGRKALEAARLSRVIGHDAVRRAKHEALGTAFASFFTAEWAALTTRAAALAGYVARERWWLDDYALFQALSRSMPGVPWHGWPAPIKDRDPRALDDARRQLAREVLQEQYGQWIAETQWQHARAAAATHGVSVVGDLPFVSRGESPEVWARAGEFMLDVSTGVPPDAFSDTGQDWGLPTYRWDVIAGTGYAWFQRRARRMAALFDGIRVDHAVGLYRTYARPRAGDPYFIPDNEAAQRAQGEAVFTILKDSGLDLIAEDLGVIPEFVRASLGAMGIPGCKVIRWERDWHASGQPFLDPLGYPSLAAAMTGTHDTEPMATWWDELSQGDRAAFVALPMFEGNADVDPGQLWTDALRDAVLELAYRSGADRLFLPIQDLFGWTDRINTPGTVDGSNWTWCLPWPVDRLHEVAASRDRAAFLGALAGRTSRRASGDYTKARPPARGAPA